MSLQPEEEEQSYLPNGHEYAQVETSQYSQNNVPKPIIELNFSSITDIFNNLASDIKNLNDTERDSSNLFDAEDKLDEIIKDAESNFADMSGDEQFEFLIKQLDALELEAIDQSIQNRIMNVEIQPPTDIRRRYESDGKRQIEKSRSKPMAIILPNLKNCKIDSNLSFWLQLSLLTTDQNPSNISYIHPDKLEYHADDVIISDHGSVRIPLTQENIQEPRKQLARISIIKKKLDAYTFELIPFNSLSANNTIPITIYENKNKKSVVAKAKCFRDLYNLTSSHIACQLLIKQNDTWRVTDIVCQTNIMEEKKQTDDKTSNKRPISSHINNDDDDDNRISSKKRKQSPSLIETLPVTRIKE